MTANEHIQSKAVQLEGLPLPFDSSKAFPQAAGSQWNIFPLYTLYAWLPPSPHVESVTVVTCVEYGFVSHLIGDKIGIATFFILNCAFWKQVAIEHTHPHFHRGREQRASCEHQAKPWDQTIPKMYNHLAFQLILIFLETWASVTMSKHCTQWLIVPPWYWWGGAEKREPMFWFFCML